MSLADEMRAISAQAGNGKVEAAYATVMDSIKKAAEEGRREIVWSPYIRDHRKYGYDSMYITDREKELLRDKLEREGFRIVQPHRVSGGIVQLTKYIQW